MEKTVEQITLMNSLKDSILYNKSSSQIGFRLAIRRIKELFVKNKLPLDDFQLVEKYFLTHYENKIYCSKSEFEKIFHMLVIFK